MSNAENILQNKPLSEDSRHQRLSRLLARPDIWQAANGISPEHSRRGIATVDALLAGRGWPRGATTELLVDRSGIGEITLLIPHLRGH